MSFVHTAFGRGQIVGEETVRGRKQYLVAGNGFKLWVDEADAQIHTGAADFDFEPAEDVNEENSTDLPYNPEPQFPVEGFSDEQTIQPNHELDADDRLSPADSLTFDEVGDREYPGPAEHLFARRTAAGFDYSPPIDPDEFLDFCKHYGLDPEDPESEETYDAENFEHTLSVGREGTRHLAGLSDKYIEITADADHYNDPVQRFRDDPIREINRVAHNLSDIHDDDRMEHYAALVDSDPMLREAAWSDVRQKAQRIRREGKMDVHDIDNNQIYATVHGDHGDYDVMIVKGGLGGNSITQWTCTCDWGRHAFKRKVLHVGRLCSHGLAGWLEMQSHELSDVAKKHPYKKRAAHDEVTLEDLIGPPYEEDHGRVPASRPRREIDPELAELLDEDYLREHGYRIADVIDDYKKFNDEYNDGHVDKATADNFISRPHQAGGIEPMEPEDVDKLYNYVEDNKTQPGRRNYEVPYTLDPDKAYKQAEVLRTSPHSLTPDLKFIPKGEDEHFVDVEEDERETTGPDQIVHFSNRRHAMPAPRGTDPDFTPRQEGGDHGDIYYGDGDWFSDYGQEPDAEDRARWRELTRQRDEKIQQYIDSTGKNPYVPEGQDDYDDFMEDMIGAGDIETDNSGPVPVHSFPSSGAAYNACQSNDSIHDGDIIHVPNEGVVGLAGTWPAAVTKQIGQLHGFKDEIHADPRLLEIDQPDYADKMTAAQFQAALEFARQHGYETGPYVKEGRRRYAGEELDPEPYRDFDGGGELLDELREESSTPLEEDFGNMRDRNDDVREIVEELREKGYDADQFVASRRRQAREWGGHLPEDLRPSSRNPDDWSDAEWEDMLLPDIDELEDAAPAIYQNIRNRKRQEREGSYGVGNQGAGPGGAFGQPGGGNWADEPFAGSGPDPKLWYESSEDYVDAHERPRYEDVTDLGDDDIIKYTEKPQQKKAWLDSPSPDWEEEMECGWCRKPLAEDNKTGFCSRKCKRESDNDMRSLDEMGAWQNEQDKLDAEFLRDASVDPIEAFYKSGAADAIKSGSRSGGGSFSDDAIAERANQFLMRTAGRNYSLAEQRELEDEEHHLGARNLDGLDLAGTHYISDL